MTAQAVAKSKKLVIYLMAGHNTPELAKAAAEGGADILELGFPFSDPLADGPVIRQAAETALSDGMTTEACIDCLSDIRSSIDIPIIPMTYAALFEAYGWQRLVKAIRSAGAESIIIADVPVDIKPEIRRIQLIAPTSTDERIRIGAETTESWLYLVTVTGTTGVRSSIAPSFTSLVKRVRALTDRPLYAGFGISTPEQAQATAEITDGVIVGSRALLVAKDGPESLRKYVATLREALDQ